MTHFEVGGLNWHRVILSWEKDFLKDEVINLNQYFYLVYILQNLNFDISVREKKKHVDNIKSDDLLQYENMVDLYKTYLYQISI